MYAELKENHPHGTREYPFCEYHMRYFPHAFQIPVHWHDEMEIIYVRKGPLTVEIDGQKFTGEEYYFIEGTRLQNAQVFAGKGGVKPLREEVAQGLAAEFGGKPEDWQHCKAQGWLDVNGEQIKAEVHWFQNGSEKVKFKVKEWLYDED